MGGWVGEKEGGWGQPDGRQAGGGWAGEQAGWQAGWQAGRQEATHRMDWMAGVLAGRQATHLIYHSVGGRTKPTCRLASHAPNSRQRESAHLVDGLCTTGLCATGIARQACVLRSFLGCRSSASSLSISTLALCLRSPPSSRCLFSLRSYKWDKLPSASRPEGGLLGLRSNLNAFANLRPAIVPRQVGAARHQYQAAKYLNCVSQLQLTINNMFCLAAVGVSVHLHVRHCNSHDN